MLKPGWVIACALLLWLVLSPAPVQATPRGGQEMPSYELDAVIYVREGYVAEATWLDADQYIYLAVSPDGAAVWRYNYTESTKERFISANFIEQNICPSQYAARLSWTLSPGKRLLFTHYFDDAGKHFWNLLDISGAPNFRLKTFAPPAGMQINRALFSPDDRFGVFVHDSFQEGSDVSVLALDFETGAEYWRVTTHDLSFIDQLWWGAAIYDAPRVNAVAQLYNGEFKERNGLAKLDLAVKTINFVPDAGGVMLGSEALWGEAVCTATGSANLPYELVAHIPGQAEMRVGLTAKPVAVEALPQAGLVLLANSADQVTTDLWLVDVVRGEKELVDQDCAGFSLASDGKLLVRGQKKNALRVYVFSDADQAAGGAQ